MTHRCETAIRINYESLQSSRIGDAQKIRQALMPLGKSGV